MTAILTDEMVLMFGFGAMAGGIVGWCFRRWVR